MDFIKVQGFCCNFILQFNFLFYHNRLDFIGDLCYIFDTLLRQYLKVVKNYICDDIDSLTKIPRETDEKKVLATFDITSMYTNINNDLGYKAIRFWLEKHPELTTRNILKDSILDALKLVLEFNMFHFNN